MKRGQQENKKSWYEQEGSRHIKQGGHVGEECEMLEMAELWLDVVSAVDASWGAVLLGGVKP